MIQLSIVMVRAKIKMNRNAHVCAKEVDQNWISFYKIWLSIAKD